MIIASSDKEWLMVTFQNVTAGNCSEPPYIHSQPLIHFGTAIEHSYCTPCEVAIITSNALRFAPGCSSSLKSSFKRYSMKLEQVTLSFSKGHVMPPPQNL